MGSGAFLRSAALLAVFAAAGCGVAPTIGDRSALVTEFSPCAMQRLDIYFDEGGARLTAPARRLIALTGEQIAHCRVERVEVLGLASATGGSRQNQTLSERRAATVAEAMIAAGWPAPEFTLAAAGDTGALTDEGLNEPLRRRTEIVIHASPR